MQTGYFNAAWQDIKNSPGWFGKLVLLSLLSLIPIFGWLVVLGYLVMSLILICRPKRQKQKCVKQFSNTRCSDVYLLSKNEPLYVS